LVLLLVGFTLPRLLPAARCALTAPFHPCPFTMSPARPADLAMGRRFAGSWLARAAALA